jgi:hypothetical protein
MGKSYTQQLQSLVQSFGLTLEQVPVIKYLTSFHEVSRDIRQRSDTQQYIYTEHQESYCDVDDYFTWKYITEEEFQQLKKSSIL